MNLSHKDLDPSIDLLDNWWNIHRVWNDTVTSREKPSSNGHICYCVWGLGIFHEFHWYKTRYSVGWHIAVKVKIWFKLHVTATLGFHSVDDRCYQKMWLCSGAPEDPEDNTVTEKHSAEAFHSTGTSLMHAVRTGDEEAQRDGAHQLVQIAKSWMITRWSESKGCKKKITPSDTQGECTPHWYRKDCRQASKNEECCGVIHFMRYFRSMEGS